MNQWNLSKTITKLFCKCDDILLLMSLVLQVYQFNDNKEVDDG